MLYQEKVKLRCCGELLRNNVINIVPLPRLLMTGCIAPIALWLVDKRTVTPGCYICDEIIQEYELNTI